MDGKFSQKMLDFEKFVYLCGPHYTVPVVQLVRASDCGSECRGFESHQAPDEKPVARLAFFVGYHGTYIYLSPNPLSVGQGATVSITSLKLGGYAR